MPSETVLTASWLPELRFADPVAMERATIRDCLLHRVALDGIDTGDEKLFSMNAGDRLFFTNYTWHRSEPNRSKETKMIYAIAYRRR